MILEERGDHGRHRFDIVCGFASNVRQALGPRPWPMTVIPKRSAWTGPFQKDARSPFQIRTD